jgi:oxygen-independent coproporphyrinogen-3 oxidase
MLRSATADLDAVRFAPADSLEKYVSATGLQRTPVSRCAALEESFFLGLRLNRGVSLRDLSDRFGQKSVEYSRVVTAELVEGGLMELRAEVVSLTRRGRLLSNEVFERFILADEVAR